MVNVYLTAAAIFCVLGLGWLALTIDAHWKQVRNDKPSSQTILVLRYLGWSALFTSLLFCLAADHPSMASLVWVMLLAASALIVAFTFTLRPRFFVPLVAWVKAVN